MKKLYILMCLVGAMIISARAQTPQLWGTTQRQEGYLGAGTVIRLNLDGSGFATPFVCNCHGQQGTGNLNQAGNGLLYGMANYGGLYGAGVIYSVDTTSGTYSELYNFADDSSSGATPFGSLTRASNGLFYGMTVGGGVYNNGVIFSFNPLTNTYTNLYSFQGYPNDGAAPYASLLQASNGLLYGMTTEGGAYYDGVIFSYNIGTLAYNVLYDFGDSNSGSFGNLIEGQDGLLYGLSDNGGDDNGGVIFSFNTTTSAYRTTYKFEGGLNGQNPVGDLVQTANGMFYGLVENGGAGAGGIFSYDLTTSTEQLIYGFDTERVSTAFDQSMTQASNGILYGMTGYNNGNGVKGSIFSYNLQTSTFNENYLFTGSDSSGAYPQGGLFQATNGLLYGMAQNSGLGTGDGVIFNYSTVNSNYKNIYSFANGAASQGCVVNPGSVHASNGLLYGTTFYGGANFEGTIFSLNPANSVYTKVYDFNGDSGSTPIGFLMQASNGLLYSTTQKGGANNDGVIYSYNPQTSAYRVLYNFSSNDSSDGTNIRGLVQASNGLLYGMSGLGGVNGYGFIFSFDPVSLDYRYLYSFTPDSNNGYRPLGSMVQIGNGLLYGLTPGGGAYQKGVIFSFDPVTLKYTNLYSFSDSVNSGGQPNGSLIAGSDNLLYAMATGGGDSSMGAIFRFNPVTLAYSNLYSFTGGPNSGSFPYENNLMQASNGLLYGATYRGGTYNTGVVFSFDPVSETYNNLLSLADSIPNNPIGDLIEINPNDTVLTCTNVYNNIFDSICSGDSLLFNGVYLHLAGNYNDSIALVSGCDSIVTLNLVVNNPSYTTINDTVCGSTVFNGNTVTQSGTYYDTLQTINGCDSIVTLNLIVNSLSYTSINDTVCGSTVFNGNTITESGTYYDTLQTINGCDSIVTLNLQVNPILSDSVMAAICVGSSYPFNGQNYDTDGVYTATFTSINGCDSVVTLLLSVNSFLTSSTSDTTCSGTPYVFNGLSLTQAGTYYDTLQAAGGCDSIVTLHLTVNQPAYDSITKSICAGDTFYMGNKAYSAPGTFSDTLTNAAGCDSIVKVNLTVNPLPVVTLSWDSMVILQELAPGIPDTEGCFQNKYRFAGGQPAGGIYSAFGESGDTIFSPFSSGFQYEGLDTIYYTFTDSNGCSASASDTALFTICLGIQQISDNNAISLYPNPTTDQLYIKTEGIQAESITIYDVNGRSISTMPFQPELDVSKLSSGVYLIEVQSNMGVARKRFVKM